jgi:hypothetical protein
MAQLSSQRPLGEGWVGGERNLLKLLTWGMGKFEVVSQEHVVLSHHMGHRYLQTSHTHASSADGSMDAIRGSPWFIRFVNSITSPDG